MNKTIYFDMDGTVADLYNSIGWLDKVENQETGAFVNLAPMVDMEELGNVCKNLQAQGWTIGVITWLPMRASELYETECSEEKHLWISKHMPYVQEMYCQSYGTPKQYAPKHNSDIMVLVDDNKEVRQMWENNRNRLTIDATKNIIEELKRFLRD